VFTDFLNVPKNLFFSPILFFCLRSFSQVPESPFQRGSGPFFEYFGGFLLLSFPPLFGGQPLTISRKKVWDTVQASFAPRSSNSPPPPPSPAFRPPPPLQYILLLIPFPTSGFPPRRSFPVSAFHRGQDSRLLPSGLKKLSPPLPYRCGLRLPPFNSRYFRSPARPPPFL